MSSGNQLFVFFANFINDVFWIYTLFVSTNTQIFKIFNLLILIFFFFQDVKIIEKFLRESPKSEILRFVKKTWSLKNKASNQNLIRPVHVLIIP